MERRHDPMHAFVGVLRPDGIHMGRRKKYCADMAAEFPLKRLMVLRLAVLLVVMMGAVLRFVPEWLTSERMG